MIKQIWSNKVNNGRSLFFLFCLPLSLVLLVECMMAYYFPIVAENTIGSNTTLGLILGLSNVVALACDLIFPQIFSKRSWRFLLLAAIVFSLGLNIFTNLGVISFSIISFVIAALFWNVYYEFLAFAQQSFESENEKDGYFTRDWGFISAMWSIAMILGPILASKLLEGPTSYTFFVISFLQGSAFLFALLIVFKSKKHNQLQPIRSKRKQHLNLLKELQYWRVLGIRIFPAMILGFTITVIYSSVWTIGGLLGEEIFKDTGFDWTLIVLFSLSSLISTVMLFRVKIKAHKKYLSQILLFIGGCFLLWLSVFRGSPVLIAISFFLVGFFYSTSWSLSESVYTDLIERSGKNKLHLIGFIRVNNSLGYMAGPIIAGFLADRTDYITTFSIIGIFTILVAVLLLIMTPKKLKLPQTELSAL